MTQVTEELRADEALKPSEIDPSLRDKIVGGFVQPTKFVPYRRPGINVLNVAAGLAVSAVVIAVFFPIFAQTREKARNVAFAPALPRAASAQVANVHSMGLALNQYTQGVDEAYPATGQPQPAYSYSKVHEDAGTAFTLTSNSIAQPLDFTLRQVHKEATIGVDVDDPEAASDEVEGKVKAMAGYVETSNLTTGDDGRKTAQMTVKVPVDQFEPFMSQVSHMGSVANKNVTAEDITEKVSDAHVRTSVLEDEANKAEARLKLLGKKSKWDDAETARELRVQLSQARARLVLLKKLGDLATIDVTLTQKHKPPTPPASGFMSGMSESTQSALGSMLTALGSLLTVVIWIVIYAPIWLPAGLFGRWLYRRYRTSTSQASS